MLVEIFSESFAIFKDGLRFILQRSLEVQVKEDQKFSDFSTLEEMHASLNLHSSTNKWQFVLTSKVCMKSDQFSEQKIQTLPDIYASS